MSLWWIPAGLIAWCVLAVLVALVLGPVLARSSQAREAASEDPACRLHGSRDGDAS